MEGFADAVVPISVEQFRLVVERDDEGNFNELTGNLAKSLCTISAVALVGVVGDDGVISFLLLVVVIVVNDEDDEPDAVAVEPKRAVMR